MILPHPMNLFSKPSLCLPVSVAMAITFLLAIATHGSVANGKVVADADIEVPSKVSHWCIEEETGRVFCTLFNESCVVEYNASGKEVRRWQVGSLPTMMIIKSKKLVVVSSGPHSLQIIDLITNQENKPIKLPAEVVTTLFCSKADNPYVFCLLDTTTPSVLSTSLMRLDVEKSVLKSCWDASSWVSEYVVSVAMSPDGTRILVQSAIANNPVTRYRVVNVDEETCLFVSNPDLPNRRGTVGLIAAPDNRYWGIGKALFSFDGSKQIREYEADTMAIHPAIDLTVSLTSNELVLQKFSDATAIAKIPLPTLDFQSETPKESTTTQGKSADSSPTIAFDLKNHFVFIGTRQKAYWIDLKKYASSLKRHNSLRLPSLNNVFVGQETQIPILVGQRKPTSDFRLKLKGSSTTAVIEDSVLKWTPTMEHIGNHLMQIELYNNEDLLLDTLEVTFSVFCPYVELGFSAHQMQLSVDEKRIAIWGGMVRQESGPSQCPIAIVDLETLRVTHQSVLPKQITKVEIDDEKIYIAMEHTGSILVMNHDMLDRSNAKTTASRVLSMKKIAPNILAVGGATLELFDTTTWTPVATDRRGWSNYASDDDVEYVGRNLVRIEGLVIDPKTFETRRIYGTTYSIPAIEWQSVEHRSDMFPPTGWGRDIQYARIMDENRQQIVGWENHDEAIAVSPYAPYLVLLTTEQEKDMLMSRLVFRNLADGTVSHTALVCAQERSRQPRRERIVESKNRVVAREKDVFFLDYTRLHRFDLPKSVSESLPIPAHFSLSQPMEILVGGDDALQLNIGGKPSEYSLKLVSTHNGVTLDEESGKLMIDTKTVWNRFIESKIDPPSRTSFPNDDDDRWRNHTVNAAFYQRLGAKELPEDRFAIQLPIRATITDTKGFQDKLNMVVLLLGPQHDVDQIPELRKARVLKINEDRIAERLRISEENAAKEAQALILRAQQKSANSRTAMIIASVISFVFVGGLLFYAWLVHLVVGIVKWKTS